MPGITLSYSLSVPAFLRRRPVDGPCPMSPPGSWFVSVSIFPSDAASLPQGPVRWISLGFPQQIFPVPCRLVFSKILHKEELTELHKFNTNHCV